MKPRNVYHIRIIKSGKVARARNKPRSFLWNKLRNFDEFGWAFTTKVTLGPIDTLSPNFRSPEFPLKATGIVISAGKYTFSHIDHPIALNDFCLIFI